MRDKGVQLMGRRWWARDGVRMQCKRGQSGRWARASCGRGGVGSGGVGGPRAALRLVLWGPQCGTRRGRETRRAAGNGRTGRVIEAREEGEQAGMSGARGAV